MWTLIMTIRGRRRRERLRREAEMRALIEPIAEDSQEHMDLAELNKLFKIERFLKRRICTRDTDIEDGCCICLGDIEKEQKYITLHCGHQFHHKCIRDWIRTKPNCPLCRKTCNLKRRLCWN